MVLRGQLPGRLDDACVHVFVVHTTVIVTMQLFLLVRGGGATRRVNKG